MPTNKELEQENEALRAELEQARGQLVDLQANAGASTARVTFPARPQYRSGTTLSEGERADLELYGVARDPFTGGQILASDHGVDVKTKEGRANLARAQARPDRDPRPAREGVDFVYPSVAPGVLADDAPVRGGTAVLPDAVDTEQV